MKILRSAGATSAWVAIPVIDQTFKLVIGNHNRFWYPV
jgi:hypothetical protein